MSTHATSNCIYIAREGSPTISCIRLVGKSLSEPHTGQTVYPAMLIVRLLVATLQVGMTSKQDGGDTQSTQLQRDYLRWVNISFTHQ